MGGSFQCAAQSGVDFMVISNGEITAFQRVCKSTPVNIAQFGAGLLVVCNLLTMGDSREMTIIKDAVDGAEFFTHGDQCFHTAYQHSAIADYADNLFIGIGEFGGVNGGDAVAHGIKV